MAEAFVGMIEQIAERGDRVDVRLDMMPERNAARFLRSPGRLLTDDAPLEGAMLTFRASRRVARRLLGGSLSEGRWVRVQVGDSGLPATMHPSRVGEVPEPLRVYLIPGPRLPASAQGDLSRAFTLPSSDRDTHSQNLFLDWLFFHGQEVYPASLICLDVGQGSAVALTRAGRPRVYFDVGVGCFANARTKPAGLKFCTCDRPTIVLSHWDADHWFGAWTDAQLQKCDWVCPRQTIGPFATDFARLVNQNGRLLIWPDAWVSGTARPLSWLINCGFIFRANGFGRNDSGLVLAVAMHGRQALLPGDCGYLHIPVNKWSAVVGTHHGGRFKGSTPQPLKADREQESPPLVLSYGRGNTYKHPKPESIRAYESVGWRLETTAGVGNIELVVAGAAGSGMCSCTGSVARRVELR